MFHAAPSNRAARAPLHVCFPLAAVRWPSPTLGTLGPTPDHKALAERSGLGEGSERVREGLETVHDKWKKVGKWWERVGGVVDGLGEGWQRVAKGCKRVAIWWEGAKRAQESVGKGWERGV